MRNERVSNSEYIAEKDDRFLVQKMDNVALYGQ